jgi:hypothetical protein
MGSGVAQAHQATYADIVRFDSQGLAETITHDIIRVLQLVNFPGSEGIWLKFAFDTESPQMDIKLNAYRQAWEMGASIKTDDIFKLLGAARPHEDDDVLTNPAFQQQAMMPGMMPGMTGQPGMMDMGAMMQDPQQMDPNADPAGAQEMLAPLQMSASAEPVISVKPRYSDVQQFKAEPSEAQREAGNFKKKHVNWQGLRISIENEAGSIRRGKWGETKMRNDYGYIRGTTGRDGDHVDCFLGPDMDSEIVFVVDQPTKSGKRFDEHKCVIGAKNKSQARYIYLSNYSNGWRCGKITPMTVDQFKCWLDKGDTKKPVENQVSRYSAGYKEIEWGNGDSGSTSGEITADRIFRLVAEESKKLKQFTAVATR